MLTSRLDVYISRYGDFCAHDDNDDNNNDTTDYFTPCACARGNNYVQVHCMYRWDNNIHVHCMHIMSFACMIFEFQ